MSTTRNSLLPMITITSWPSSTTTSGEASEIPLRVYNLGHAEGAPRGRGEAEERGRKPVEGDLSCLVNLSKSKHDVCV